MKKIITNDTLITVIIFLITLLVIFKGDDFVSFMHGHLGHFEKISDMHVGRMMHKSFLMSDGRVLIVGGNSYNVDEGKYIYLDKNGNNSIEIFDPKTNTFIFKKEFGEDIPPKSSIVLLKNDKLLITGGEIVRSNRNGMKVKVLKTAKLYDPEKNIIVNLPNMNIARSWHTSVLLKDGRVLIFGGFTDMNKKNRRNKVIEIYDPKLNKFILLKSFKAFSSDALTNTAVLNDGNVFITWRTLEEKQLAAIFNPKTSTFKMLNIKLLKDPGFINIKFDPRRYYLENIVLLKNNKLVLFENYDGRINNIAILDLNTNEIKNIGSMKIKDRHSYETTLLSNNNILITDGYIGLYDLTWGINIDEIFDTKNLKFYKLPKVKVKRIVASAILLKDGRVLITGGQHRGIEYLKNAMIYKPN